MKIIKSILFLFIAALLLNGCKKDLSIDANDSTVKGSSEIKVPENFFKEGKIPGVQSVETISSVTANVVSATSNPLDNGDDPIVLGNQLTNPYTVPNMQTAYNTLYGGGATVVANNLYVRFRPTNTTQLETLEDNTNVELQDYPMDYEVTQDGDFYQDPLLGTEDISWLYTSVPTGFVAPAGIQYEIIAPLYIPVTDTLLETMAESLAAGATYKATTVNGNRIITRTDQTAESLIIPIANRPLCLEGYHLVRCDSGPNCWECVPNNCPDGYYWNGTSCVSIPPPPPPLPPGIYVEEQTVCGQPTSALPLRLARVVAKRWFKIWSGYTDDNGRFNVTKNFKNKVKVIVKTKNEDTKVCKVRGIRFWQLLFPCKKRIGVFNGSELATLRHVFAKPTDGSASNKDLAYWSAATTHNSVVEFRNYTTEFNNNAPTGSSPLTLPPTKLKVMVTNWGFMNNTAATVMWNKCNDNSVPNSFIGFFVATSNFVGAGATILANTLKNQIDLIIGYKSSDYNCVLTSSRLRATVYHELGHAQHFAQAGCNFWTQYRNNIINELISSTGSDPYGNGQTANSPLIATGEMWGNHCEKWYSERHYGNGGALSATFQAVSQGQTFTNTSVAGLNANYASLERYDPNRTQDIYRWIPVGLPYDLFDNRNDFPTPAVSDNVNGFTIFQSFRALEPDVRTIPAYRDRLLLQNNNLQQTQVNQLFQQYGY